MKKLILVILATTSLFKIHTESFQEKYPYTILSVPFIAASAALFYYEYSAHQQEVALAREHMPRYDEFVNHQLPAMLAGIYDSNEFKSKWCRYLREFYEKSGAHPEILTQIKDLKNSQLCLLVAGVFASTVAVICITQALIDEHGILTQNLKDQTC